MPDLRYLQMAMIYRAQRGSVGPGAGQTALRQRIMRETPEITRQVPPVAARLAGYSIPDMPPPVDDIALLLDALAFRIGATARADAWREIGVNPNRGRDLLARNHSAFDWPLWFTLREAALGSLDI